MDDLVNLVNARISQVVEKHSIRFDKKKGNSIKQFVEFVDKNQEWYPFRLLDLSLLDQLR